MAHWVNKAPARKTRGPEFEFPESIQISAWEETESEATLIMLAV